jgi:hypothetical protein
MQGCQGAVSKCWSSLSGVPQVNWPTLWLKWHEREVREAIVLPFIIGIMLIPIGLFSGVPIPLLPAFVQLWHATLQT